MLARLGYLALVAGAVLAILVGLFPSIFTFGALLALPLGAIGLVGAFAPSVIGRRRWLRRLAIAGGIVLGAEATLVVGWVVANRRRPVLLVVESPAPSRVRVIHDVKDGEPHRWLSWERRYDVPQSGIVRTQDAFDLGLYDGDNPHPTKVRLRQATTSRDTAVGAWVAGGSTESGACKLSYDEYAIGELTTAPTSDNSHTGWLDSLDTWGVECRRGELYVAPKGTMPNLRRTGPVCYYAPDGVMACSYSARSP